MKALSLIGLPFVAAIIATVPVSPQVTAYGLEMRLDQAQAHVTRGQARRVSRRAYGQSYRYAAWSGSRGIYRAYAYAPSYRYRSRYVYPRYSYGSYAYGYRPYRYAYAYRPRVRIYRPFIFASWGYRPYAYSYAYQPYAYSYAGYPYGSYAYAGYPYRSYASVGFGPRIWIGWGGRGWRW
jgi:hypothetical protein